MKVTAYLFIDQWGGLRLTKREAQPRPTELAIRLVLTVPDTFFKRAIPVVELTLPNHFADPDRKVAAQVIAPDIADALKLDVDAVLDGLAVALRKNGTIDEVAG